MYIVVFTINHVYIFRGDSSGRKILYEKFIDYSRKSPNSLKSRSNQDGRIKGIIDTTCSKVLELYSPDDKVIYIAGISDNRSFRTFILDMCSRTHTPIREISVTYSGNNGFNQAVEIIESDYKSDDDSDGSGCCSTCHSD